MIMKLRQALNWKSFCIVFCLIVLAAGSAHAERVKDPMVRITSLPIKQNIDAVLAGMADDVSKAVGLDKSLVTYYWQYFAAINCMGEKTVDRPIYVDINVPCFMDDDTIVKLMNAIADSLVKHVGIERKWVFVSTLRAESGHVLITNKIQYCGDDTPEPKAPKAKQK
jgi:hypothetical protein